jgi:hypothetical protein
MGDGATAPMARIVVHTRPSDRRAAVAAEPLLAAVVRLAVLEPIRRCAPAQPPEPSSDAENGHVNVATECAGNV